MQAPYQTVAQTKWQLRTVLYPAIYGDFPTEDKTPAAQLGLVSETDELKCEKIKEYVTQKLESVLKNSSKRLTNVDYTSNLKKSLEGKTGEDDDLQSIVNQVRCTKNKNLNDIVDEYLKSAEIEEEKNTDKVDIADAFRYQIVDQFVNYIDQNKPIAAENPAPQKKSNIKSSGKKGNTEINPIEIVDTA